MTAFAEPMVRDELEGMAAGLCAKYPQRSRSEVESVVAAAYAELSANARVTAHLSPLTLNRSRRLLAFTPSDGHGEPRATVRRPK